MWHLVFYHYSRLYDKLMVFTILSIQPNETICLYFSYYHFLNITFLTEFEKYIEQNSEYLWLIYKLLVK